MEKRKMYNAYADLEGYNCLCRLFADKSVWTEM